MASCGIAKFAFCESPAAGTDKGGDVLKWRVADLTGQCIKYIHESVKKLFAYSAVRINPPSQTNE